MIRANDNATHRPNFLARWLMLSALGLAMLASSLMAAQACAAPQLSVDIAGTPSTMGRFDERLEYVVKVKNTAANIAPTGELLTCEGENPGHVWFDVATYSFKWLRNGTTIPGEAAKTYTTTAADEHKAIQCLVTGTNENGVSAAASPSQPPTIVTGQPAVSIPLPSNPAVEATRPTVNPPFGTGTRTCSTDSMNWIGVSSFDYQWLRNGIEIPGATSSEYTPIPGVDKGKLQCAVFPKNSEGASAISVSDMSGFEDDTFTNQNRDDSRPFAAFSNWTSDRVSLTISLPGGMETAVAKITGASTGWDCVSHLPSTTENSTLTCENTYKLEPSSNPEPVTVNGEAGSYTPLTILVSIGDDAPFPTGGATATVSGGGSAAASDTAEYTRTPCCGFGVLENSFYAGVFDEADTPDTKGGGHPFKAFTTFGFNVHLSVANEATPTGSIKDTVVDAPRGFVGNALAAPVLCPTIEDVLAGACPENSAVGGIDIYTVTGNGPPTTIYPDIHAGPFNRPIYSVEPEYGQPAQFAFAATGEVPYTFVPELRADEGYAISFRTAPILTAPQLWGTNVTLCDFGARLAPRSVVGAGGDFTGCKKAIDPDANPTPLITNPTRCSGPPPSVGLRVNSWEHPDEIKTYAYTAPPITECDQIQFEPEAELAPTNHQADAPTGLTVEFKMPIDGVLSPTGVSQANLDTATVTLPKGMTINAATADGLGACSLAQIKLYSNAPDECPESSRVGQIEIDTPLIRETLKGSIYVAKQKDNPFNENLGLYMSFSSPRDGVRIKVAGKVVPDPVTGQLVSTFTENPEAPFSRLALHFNSGPRAPLVNPPKCGTYAIHAEFSPWSAVNPANPTPDEIVVDDSTYEVTSGPNGSPCPNGALAPKLSSGVQNTQAGSRSPFVFTLSRDDGTQRFSQVDVTTPKGLTAYLKGIPYCSDATLAGISGAELTGNPELANPSCPPASQVGTSQAGAGAGLYPFYAPGKVYLAGPYKGAPVSLAVVTPAVAGPFDLGNVVVRNPLYVDPVTSQVKTETDPIPTMLHGIVIDVRDIRVALDRPNFTQAPTNCEAMAVDAHVKGEEGSEANVSNRFQVGGCENLDFKPKLGFRLFGGTHRGSHPRLRATVTMPPGGANIASTSVALPHSEFLDQGHIKTVCTRVQYAADQCPAGSIYGQAEATTPLLDNPVKGPVYLRSSSNQLPDMVIALKGPDAQPIEIDLAGRIDSIHGGIRATFEQVPDQPVSSFTLNMQGGKKGLLVNSKNICIGTQKATAVFGAQNGKSLKLRPVMKNACGKSSRKGKKHKNNGKGAKRHNSR